MILDKEVASLIGECRVKWIIYLEEQMEQSMVDLDMNEREVNNLVYRLLSQGIDVAGVISVLITIIKTLKET